MAWNAPDNRFARRYMQKTYTQACAYQSATEGNPRSHLDRKRQLPKNRHTQLFPKGIDSVRNRPIPYKFPLNAILSQQTTTKRPVWRHVRRSKRLLRSQIGKNPPIRRRFIHKNKNTVFFVILIYHFTEKAAFFARRSTVFQIIANICAIWVIN